MLRTLLRSGGAVLKNTQRTNQRLWLVPAQQRWASSLPMNTVVLFVPQQEAWVVQRMGRFHRILEPGLNFLIPILDRIRYVQSLKEIVIDVPEQSAVSLVTVSRTPKYCRDQLAQTTMRSELGKLTLDKVFRLVAHGRVVRAEAVATVVHAQEVSHQDIPVPAHHWRKRGRGKG
ncbi:hypothetical protein CRUP_038478, partial [Coryphaenoides rupestris]